MAPESIDDLLAGYREGANGTSSSDPKVANKWQRRMHGFYKKLRETEEGKAAIVSLLDDPSPHVRCWAGAHCLQWNTPAAMRTLEALRDGKGSCSFTAEITLREFDRGRLSFDY